DYDIGGIGFNLSPGGTVGVAAAVDPTLTATITLKGSSAKTIDVRSGATLEVIRIDGTGGLTKTGSGTLVLRGGNSYSAVTTNSAGTLKVGASGALGATGATNNTLVMSGATLIVSTGSNPVNESLTISGNGADGLGAWQGDSGAWGGPVTLAGDTSVTVALV